MRFVEPLSPQPTGKQIITDYIDTTNASYHNLNGGSKTSKQKVLPKIKFDKQKESEFYLSNHINKFKLSMHDEIRESQKRRRNMSYLDDSNRFMVNL